MPQIPRPPILSSTFLTFVLPFTSLGLVALAPSISHAWPPTPTCELKKVSEVPHASRVDLQVGSRKIVILGWTHFSPAEADHASVTRHLNSAFRAAQKSECTGAAQSLRKLWMEQSEHAPAHRNLLTELEKVSTEFSLDALGAEHSPQSWHFSQKGAEDQASVVKSIADHCSSATDGLIANVAVLFPGPEYHFAKRRGSTLRIEPIEDEALRARALALAQELARQPSLDLHTMKPRAFILYQQFLEKHQDGTPMPQEQIDAILNAQGANETGRDLEKTLRVLKQLLDLNPLRNQKMADKILKGSGNYVIPIGNTHVTDLAKQIFERCRRGEGINVPTKHSSAESQEFSTNR